MRVWGEIGGIHYKRQRWDIYHLAWEYTLTKYGEWTKTVYVDDIDGLRAAIAHFAGEEQC